MDNLSRDAKAAADAGMSYGQWKALHPCTNPDKNGDDLAGAKVNDRLVRCKCCGKEFVKTSKNLVLCSDECRLAWKRQYNREYNIRMRQNDYND